MSDLKLIDALEAERLLAKGALLLDVREADEYAREAIQGARSAPLSRVESWQAEAPLVIFHCQSGMRTAANAALLGAKAGGDAYILAGGLEGWRKAGLPLRRDHAAPLPMQRQVMIAAGALILLFAALATTVDARFWWLDALIGAGLLQAGVTGWCGLAKLLALAPWNRARA